ncbi:MAG: HAD-IB family hydrolase [Caulobacteraceae bacterium]|nr:HAD-IB family hydrolase [Caulobacteraceae bacterium]
MDDLRQGELFYRPIVAFDFDGTLTTRDSYTAFLAWRAGPLAYAAGLARLAPAVVSYLMRPDRGRLKAAATRQFLAGASRSEIEAEARRFAERHARTLFRPDAIRAWKRWQARNARLVIVTASPELTVAPFARGLGASALIGTRLALDETDRVTGDFIGENCRGHEKVRRLRELFGEDVRLEAAYGDTDGDLEMLALAEEKGFKVFQGTP